MPLLLLLLFVLSPLLVLFGDADVVVADVVDFSCWSVLLVVVAMCGDAVGGAVVVVLAAVVGGVAVVGVVYCRCC